MSEALEKWPIELFSRLLPRIYQIVEEINRRFCAEITDRFGFDNDRIRRMAIVSDGQIKMAWLCIVGSYSVNGVARLHTEILKNEELKDFYEMYPKKFNNKTNGITQRRFLLHGNPKLSEWVTKKIGKDWATDLEEIKKVEAYIDDEKERRDFMQIKYQNKVRLAEYIKKHNGIDVDPRSIFDVQVKRLHEYKRQLMLTLYVMHLYNELRENPDLDMLPRTFIFGAKAAPGYTRAKKIIKLINNVANVINNDATINNKIKVVFIENYSVSNAELIFAAADVSEQISTASKEASGTGNMKFMLNGALTIGTLDGANIEIAEEVGKENCFIFGMTSDEVIELEHSRTYDPWDIYNNNQVVRRVVTQLINGFYSPQDPDLFREIYDSLLNGGGEPADQYFILKDFDAYVEAQKKVDIAYRNQNEWARKAMLNVANAGKFSSDRTIEEYANEIWKLDKIKVLLPEEKA
jgi:starch phosphorylase